MPIADAYTRGAPIAGGTVPPRWTVTPGGDVMVACADGTITPNQVVFTLTGVPADVSFIQVQMNYDAAQNPPSRLRCSTDSGANWVDC